MKISVISRVPSGFARVSVKEGLVSYPENSPSGEKLMVGVENVRTLNRRKLIILARKIVRQAKGYNIKKIAVSLDEFRFPKSRPEAKDLAELLTQNFELADFEPVTHKTTPKEGWPFLEEVALIHKNPASVRKAAERGQLIGREINIARAISNTPGGEMTPSVLAQKAIELSKGLPIKVTVFNQKEMEKIGLRAVLAVGQGSKEESKFIIVDYPGRKEQPIVLAGKGITFDTGGLNIKPENHMYEMHLDMSGGAAVIQTVILAAKLKIKRHVIAIVPAVENAVSGSSLRPGDILRPYSGPSIEVKDTDAEGRLVLADALAYAEKLKPQLTVDVATLTGSAIVALGEKASVILTKDEVLEKNARKWGEESGDYVWPLPLWDEYYDYIKSDFADIANIGKKEKCGDAINAAIFLYQYAKNYPWLHIDMAPTMTPSDTDELAKGSTGSPIRLLLKIVENYRA